MAKDTDRAKGAYEAVSNVAAEEWGEAYGRLCLRLPALVQQNGLCLALAFFESKTKAPKKHPEYQRLLKDVARVSGLASDGKGVAENVRGAPTEEYIRMTNEVMRAAVYFKRYAEAILKADLTEEGAANDRAG